ncbi:MULTISPECIES: outer membrane protein assembly factor BamB family protein [unclassified Saccharicrinis]|uniref:outer membrane protein assembly factor BamB family protein n=1 Tax=unclassified Saccharicrinis TaxID=2646859 RepID=UPI003D34C636
MKRINTLKFSFLAIIITCLAIQNINAQDQYGWRGPNRDGVYPDTKLLKEWGMEGPELLWETMDAGKGWSSPVIVDNRLYITGMNEDETKETFSAYSLEGEKIYETEYANPWNRSYPDTRTTPTIVGNKAYMVSGMGEVVCIGTKKGDIIWKVDGIAEYGAKPNRFGIAEAPLVYDDKVIFCPGGEKASMIALNRKNGDLIWKSDTLTGTTNYVSPLLIEYKGIKQIIGIVGESIFGVDPDNGEMMWSFEDWGEDKKSRGSGKTATNTPLYRDGQIFMCNGYNLNAYMLKLSDNCKSVTKLWKNSDLDTHHGGFVVVDQTIYGSNWLSNATGNWVAVDWESGETKYETTWEGKGKGSVITADGMLYCFDEKRGYVGLVPVTPEKFEVKSEFKITKGEGPFWAHPVINDGILYIRHGNALMAYSISK